MTTMRVIVDEMLAPVPSGLGRYTEELTRALIEFAPAGCVVEGIVSASTEAEYALLDERLPGLGTLYKTSLARRELIAAWQHGFTRLPGGGMVHAPSLLAPLGRHDRQDGSGHQVAVTIHDVAAWMHPETLPPKRAAWQRAMAKRAHRYADAVVVPSHAVGDALRDIHDFGDRVRVIGSAAGSRLAVPADADARADRLGLPPRYILTTGGLETQSGVEYLLAALALPGSTELPVVVIGPDDIGGLPVSEAAAAAGLPEGRVTVLGELSDGDLSVVLDRAAVLVYPSLTEGFGLGILEAFHFATPVVHSDTAALAELAADAGLSVAVGDLDGYPSRLAQAVGSVVDDPEYAARLGTYGQDRAGLFSWRSSAENVWQLHADL
ncbi:glycosyltransferase involved in cell wall biosynthesis [Conyzicola lurida]|uniref:Glycosyltransferase involved in cell wall biosynthesis n=1 Tax=Conyzicola lurida TaxID=1172621 RepID=A0A841APK2_9MICO|nr:glycosyltransferase [Conyzicola lurida]MBB5844238.1 glycosyltransferase involved in cell wall biosynthesis [Conyzicola lurida]